MLAKVAKSIVYFKPSCNELKASASRPEAEKALEPWPLAPATCSHGGGAHTAEMQRLC